MPSSQIEILEERSIKVGKDMLNHLVKVRFNLNLGQGETYQKVKTYNFGVDKPSHSDINKKMADIRSKWARELQERLN